jgi:hypothetical protein
MGEVEPVGDVEKDLAVRLVTPTRKRRLTAYRGAHRSHLADRRRAAGAWWVRRRTLETRPQPSVSSRRAVGSEQEETLGQRRLRSPLFG